jgi:hypothetical protein
VRIRPVAFLLGPVSIGLLPIGPTTGAAGVSARFPAAPAPKSLRACYGANL